MGAIDDVIQLIAWIIKLIGFLFEVVFKFFSSDAFFDVIKVLQVFHLENPEAVIGGVLLLLFAGWLADVLYRKWKSKRPPASE